LLALGLSAAVVLQGHAIETARLSLGNVEGDGWSVSDLSMDIDWTGLADARTVLQADRVDLPGKLGTVRALQFSCEQAELTNTGFACNRGKLDFRSSRFGRQSLPASIHYNHVEKSVRLRLRNLRLADGRVTLVANYRDGDWTADIAGAALGLSALAAEARAAGIELPALSPAGKANIDLALRGQGARVRRATYAITLKADSFSDAAGKFAGENIDVRLSGKAQPLGNGWRIQGELAAQQGAAYIEPIYIEVGKQPILASARFDWQPGRQLLTVHDFAYEHPSSMKLSAQGQLALAQEQPVQQLHVELHNASFPSAYASYLQPWFTDSLAGNLETSGRLQGELQIKNGLPQRASVDIEAMTIQEKNGLFAFDNMAGNLDWSSGKVPEYSSLAWDGGSVYRIELGATDLEIESTGTAVRLVRPVRIPVIDGALDIESFALEYADQSGLRWEVDSILTPVSMRELTRALEWPEFGGKLSGVIPAVRYADGELTVGGVLLVRVFDGVVTLRELKLLQPFGLVPRLQVNAHIDNIDLESLTGAFSFGRIEGRLDGRVDDLVLESWRPFAFDAEFSTPKDDRSRHRISQKAVDNISNIGGGGLGGALSRTFLQFFEDFPYDRLGIRCRLANGVCDMGGVEPAERGYYLVKGRFLPPRLDVIGFADRVNWDSLVAQIIAVTGEKSAVVE
jgi:hypothetical protein